MRTETYSAEKSVNIFVGKDQIAALIVKTPFEHTIARFRFVYING